MNTHTRNATCSPSNVYLQDLSDEVIREAIDKITEESTLKGSFTNTGRKVDIGVELHKCAVDNSRSTELRLQIEELIKGADSDNLPGLLSALFYEQTRRSKESRHV